MSIFDTKLKEIRFYTKFEKMLPWIGSNYVSDKHKKLLIVGESHYYPANVRYVGDVSRYSPEEWYSNKPVIFEGDEEQWIFTRNIIEWGSETNWKAKGFLMNKNIELALSEAGLSAENKIGDRSFIFDEIAFMNYFIRPAFQGDSFKHIKTKLDSEKAFENFIKVINIIKPEIIIFVSKYALVDAECYSLWLHTEPIGCKYTYTTHSSCSWWNRVSSDKILAGRTGRQHFVHFLKEQNFI